MLMQAGWHPGRRDSARLLRWAGEFFPTSGFVLSAAAEAALAELAGITVTSRGPGKSIARAGFEIDPTLAAGECDRFADFERVIGSALCPLGEADDGRLYLAVAEDGRLVTLMDDAWILGDSLEEGLAALLLGRKGRPVFTGAAEVHAPGTSDPVSPD